MKNLLSVDWDFFFPNPMENGEPDFLYDWGHRESELFINMLWPAREYSFHRAGKALPMCHGYKGFWDKFTFEKDAELFVAESHSAIANVFTSYQLPALRDARTLLWPDRIVSFDAHHDAGYKDETPKTVANSGRVFCDTWALYAKFLGIQVRVYYPDWRTNAFTQEPVPNAGIERKFEQNTRVRMPFYRAFLCRSGAWVPAWCDDQFFEFVDAFPGRVIHLPDNTPLANRMTAEYNERKEAEARALEGIVERMERAEKERKAK